MRARSLKPSLFKNELLGTADPLLTILFEGLWCEADRAGRLEDRPMRIKAEVFPYRENLDIEALLVWLCENGFIRRYAVKGLKVIQVLEFLKHQRPHTNEMPTALPPMEEADTTKVRRTLHQGNKRLQPRRQALRSDSGLLTPSSLTPDSGLLTPDCLMIPSESMSSAKPLDDVRRVFEHWGEVWDHPKAHLDVKRRALIRRALEGYSAEDLCASISGYKHSPFHTGQNDAQTVYDKLELFLRNAGTIDQGLSFARDPPTLTSNLTNHNVAVLSTWKPQEQRDGTDGRGEISVDDGGSGGGLRKAALAAPH